VLVQGDSRKLRENLRGVLASVVSSPPYNLPMSQDHNGSRGGARGTEPSEGGAFVKYGSTPVQLEGLPLGDVAAVVTSPPFLDARSDTTPSIKGATAPTKHDPEAWGGADAVISSPPYAESLKGDSSERETAEDSRAKRITEGGSLGQSCRHSGYGGPGNLGNLPSGEVDSVVTSPPFEAVNHGTNGSLVDMKAAWNRDPKNAHKPGFRPNQQEQVLSQQRSTKDEYGGSDGQLGNEQGDTFWAAASMIVAECHAILKPGGYAAFVVKSFVRNKQIVDFPGDWRKLCEACGFECVREVRAMLVKEHRHPDLFGGDDHVKTTERKSFFRRLYEKKYPENSIDYEVVQFFRKP
jgi:hypothetical protein